MGFPGILLDEATLSERGTSVAVFDYADCLRQRAGLDVKVMFNTRTSTNAAVTRRFTDRFATLGYADEVERRRMIEKHAGYLYYYLRAGKHDIRAAPGATTACHAVFAFRADMPAGKFAYVSDWLSGFMSGGRVPVVPHIVDLPKPQSDFRRLWAIPADATVVGRHGGLGTFDVPFVWPAIEEALRRRRDLWVVLVNTDPVLAHPRIRYVPAFYAKQDKADFIATCDVMLHARQDGESFGLALAEFLFLDRPVLCWAGGRDRNHIRLQPEPGNIYRTAADLSRLLAVVAPYRPDPARRAAVAGFSPSAVAEKFVEVFLRSGAPTPADEPILALYEWRRHAAKKLRFVRDRFDERR